MTLDDAGMVRQEGRIWLRAKLLVAAAPFVLFTLFYFSFQARIKFSVEQFPNVLTYSAISLILAGTYFYTYKFFAHNFYLFIAFFWLSIAVYVPLDVGRPVYSDSGFYAYSVGLNLLTLSSDAFLLLALLSVGVRKLARVKWTIIGASVVGIVSLVVPFLFVPELLINRDIINLINLTSLGSAISFLLLCVVGAVLSDSLRGETVNWTRKAILYTYCIYALLQLLHPLTVYRLMPWLVPALYLYFIAQLVKVSNAIAMQGAIQSVIATRNARTQFEVDFSRAELEVAKEKLHSMNQLEELGALAASIKHDINTPLATMSFDISALKDSHQHAPEIVRKLERLEESMERIYSIVKVVDIIRGDRVFYDNDRFMNKASVLEIVHRAIRAIKNEKGELKHQNAKTSIRVEGKDVYVRGYMPMLEQVVVNIIKNGLEAIEEAGRERGAIKINVGIADLPLQKYWRWAKVELEDNGVGIPEENFEELTTLFTTKGDKKPNSGVGLFISRKVVDIHEGSMSFESKVGDGTKVTIMLPEWNARQTTERQNYESSQDIDVALTSEQDS